MEDIKIKFQHHQQEIKKIKNNIILLELFLEETNEYINNFYFDIFKQKPNEKKQQILKKKESLYDKLFETILRNNEILKQKNEIEKISNYQQELEKEKQNYEKNKPNEKYNKSMIQKPLIKKREGFSVFHQTFLKNRVIQPYPTKPIMP